MIDKRLFPAMLAALCVAQWLVFRAAGAPLPAPWDAVLPGLCVVGAAFLMTWAAEAAEMDLPQNIAVGLLALLAVLPEYAVDMYFAWKAGKNPVYAAYATANMTGANRMLIGLGWPAVFFVCWYRRGFRSISITERNAIELVTLLAATLYSFVLPIKGTLSLWDSAALLGLFIAYAWISSGAAVEEPELEGTAKLIAALPTGRRRGLVGTIFAFAAVGIGLAAGPFAEGVLSTGKRFGVEEFLLVQWLAPLASEAPEFIVAMIFSFKGKPGVGMRALLSSKVNQWTLLVGMIPFAYCLSSGKAVLFHLDSRQVEEILLTSAQSLFGLVLLLDLHFTLREAAALLILFVGQIFFPQPMARYAFAAIYVSVSGVLLLAQEHRRQRLSHIFKVSIVREPSKDRSA